jgi:hypothetical protein
MSGRIVADESSDLASVVPELEGDGSGCREIDDDEQLRWQSLGLRYETKARNHAVADLQIVRSEIGRGVLEHDDNSGRIGQGVAPE